MVLRASRNTPASRWDEQGWTVNSGGTEGKSYLLQRNSNFLQVHVDKHTQCVDRSNGLCRSFGFIATNKIQICRRPTRSTYICMAIYNAWRAVDKTWMRVCEWRQRWRQRTAYLACRCGRRADPVQAALASWGTSFREWTRSSRPHCKHTNQCTMYILNMYTNETNILKMTPSNSQPFKKRQSSLEYMYMYVCNYVWL